MTEKNRSSQAMSLEELDVHPLLATAFARALQAEFGHNAPETRKQAHRCARKLVLCLQELGLQHTIPLPATLVQAIHTLLRESGLKSSTAQSHQNIILTLLRWCYRNEPNVLSRATTFEVASFARNTPEARREISADVVKKVLAACYSEIDAVEEKLLRTRAALAGDKSGIDGSLFGLISDLLHIGGGQIPSQHQLHGEGVIGLSIHSRVEAAGGLREIRTNVYLTHRGVFPFYLSAVVQTAGNPLAIREAAMHCIERHPLRTDLEFVNWEKRRAGVEQRVDFPVDKKWSTPNLLRRLLVLNAPLRPLATPQERDRLFLASGGHAQPACVPSVQTLHNFLADFLLKHDLDDFDFKDFRPSAARAHHVAGGTIEVARKRLNHQSARTTARHYSGPEDVAQFNDEAIVRYQGQLISASKSLGSSAQKKAECGSVDNAQRAETVFGFLCADPFAGLDGRAPKGSRCMHFNQCSGCSGAIVPVDDPQVIAKVLTSLQALKDAKSRAERAGWEVRFKKLYGPTLEVIENEILPFVHSDVLQIARAGVNPALIPALE